MQKRQKIVDELFGHFDKQLFEAVILQGSTVHGNVRDESDIDLLFVIKQENLDKIFKYDIFYGEFINETGKELFRDSKIDCFWNDYYIDGILLNMGFINYDFFKDWVKLEIGALRMFKPFRKELSSEGFTIDKEPVTIHPTITSHKDSYILTIPLILNKTPLIQPLYCNFLLSKILFDKNNVGKEIQKLRGNIVKQYGIAGLMNLVEYSLNKATPEFREQFEKKLRKK